MLTLPNIARVSPGGIMARLDPVEGCEIFKDRVKKSISASFPQVGDKNILDLENIEVIDKISSADVADQKNSKTHGKTWGMPVQATLVLKDKTTGKVIDRRTQKIATLPKITNRYSYILDGSEYQVDNQWRLKPGIYTKVLQNGDLNSFFNIKGRPIHINFDPKQRTFKAKIGGSNPPLYPIMKALGHSDASLEKAWGSEILEANKLDGRGRPLKMSNIITDFAKRLNPSADITNTGQAADVIKETLASAELDPSSTKRTLGQSFSSITPKAVLASSNKLLGLARGEQKPDVRDSLMYKDFYSIEDFAAERIDQSQKVISRRIKNNIDRKDSVRDIVGMDIFNRPIREFLTKVSLSSTPSQTNPLKMISGQMRTTIAGEGGVKDANRITEDAKLVDPSHFGILDPLHTPEGKSTGVSLQLSLGAQKKGHKITVPMIDAKTKKPVYLSPDQINDSVIALPDAIKMEKGQIKPAKGSKVRASIKGNELGDVPIKDVQYIVPKSSQMFSLATNLVPFISSVSPNRSTMAGRHMEQAIPLKDSEAPLVQSTIADQSFDDIIGTFASHKSPVAGTIQEITPDNIIVKDQKGKKHTVQIYNNYPLNDKKGFITANPAVKVGDKVSPDQLLADTNFTKNGTYAPGKNLRLAYMPWKGLTFEDGVVISESAAKKMTSEHMLKKGLSTKDNELASAKKFQSYYPDRMNKDQMAKLDDSGVIKIGQKVRPGDTLIAALQKQELTTEQQKLRLLHRSLVKPYKDKSIAWEEDHEGIVVDVIKRGKNVDVHVKTEEPMTVGDKLCYDEQTDILTTTGWKPFPEVTLADYVCCLTDNDQIVYEQPEAVHSYPTGGKMFRAKSSQVDLFVTEDHNMFVRAAYESEYKLIKAKDIVSSIMFYKKIAKPFAGIDKETFTFPDKTNPITVPMNVFLKLLGAYLNDGATINLPYPGIVLHKLGDDDLSDVYAALTDTCLHNNEGGSFRILSAPLHNYFSQFSDYKFIPDWIFQLPADRLRYLFHQLVGQQTRIQVSSKELADDIQRLCLHLGLVANVKLFDDHFIKTLSNSYFVMIYHKAKSSAKIESFIDNYSKPVYCVTVSSGVILVRRNGKAVFSGNCGRFGNKGICYDRSTEVLTNNGWKPISSVSENDEICTLNSDHRRIEYQKPTNLISYRHSGQMYLYESRRLNVCVTPEHNLYVRTGRGKYHLEPAKDCFGHVRVHLRTGMWIGEEREYVEINGQQYRTDEFLEFFGFWIADGCVDHSRGYIQLGQRRSVNPEIYQEMVDSVHGLHQGKVAWECKDAVVFKHSSLCDWLQQFGKARDKFLPRWMLELSRRQLRILADQLFKTDGMIYYDSRYNHTRFELYTSSEQLANDYQELALKLGCSANIRIPKQYAPEQRVVRWSFKDEVWIYRDDRYSSEEKWVDYNDQVYCVEVPNHIIYVRRKGIPVWCGNCTSIIPDEEMPHDKDGNPVEVIMNPIGTPGRMNIGQNLETAAAKLADKTGKTFKVENFAIEDNLAHVQKQLDQAKIKDKEDLIDPSTGKTIPGIQIGKQYILKMEHQVGKKMAARDRDAYDRNLVPRGGGPHGAQALGALGIYAMLAHGAKSNLREMATIKSDKQQGGDNDELWGALQAGEMLPPPKITFAYNKFESYLKGMGVNVHKDGNSLNLLPFTDKQILEMSNGELKDAGKVIKMKTLKPEKGGLFDTKITGGTEGTNFSHIKLSSPMPNPLFEKAIMSLTNIRGPQFDRLISGQDGTTKDGKIVPKGTPNATFGPSSFQHLLSQIDVAKDLKSEETRIPSLKGQLRNESRRRIKYLRALTKAKMAPTDAYMSKYVPIIPPCMRPIGVLDDGSLQTDDLNELYKQLAIVNNKRKEFPKGTPPSVKAPVEADIYDHLKALTGLGGTLNRKHPGLLDMIAGREGPKTGFVQSTLIKRKQDLTMRSTIVPEPALSLDEAELPRKAAKEMYKPFIVRELKRTAGTTPLQAKQMIDEDDPLAQKALDRVVKERPVLLKRDPALHKYSIQAFKPRLTTGKAIKIHPLVCSGYNADFDGDQQLNSILALLPDSIYTSGYDFWNVREVKLAARFKEQLGYHNDEDHFVICDLSEFPHTKYVGSNEHIDFYNVPEGVKVVALNSLGEAELFPVTKWTHHKQRQIEIVTLGSGRQIITDDDPRAVFGVDASSLEWCRRRPSESHDQFVPVIDQIHANYDQEQFISLPDDSRDRLMLTVDLDFQFGYFLGALVGDGWVTLSNGNPHSICLGSSVDEILDRWYVTLQTVFYKNPTVSYKWQTKDKLPGSNGSGTAALYCKPLADWILPLIGHGADHKHLPPFSFTASDDFQNGLLSGLWDTDGSVSWSNAKNKLQFLCSYSSNSIRLVQEIQHLLRQRGITSTITRSKTPKSKKCWILNVSIVDLYQCCMFDLAHPGKQDCLLSFLAAPPPDDRMAYSRYRLVPLPAALAKDLRKLFPNKTQHSIYATLSKAIKRQYISKKLATDILTTMIVSHMECSHPLFPKWRSLIRMSSIHFERIRSIEVTDIKEDGYDLTVPGSETFMSTDGIILSNTMSAFVPISEESVKEARDMFPSRNLFSPATHAVMYSPTHEMQVGLFMAAQTGKKTNKQYKTRADLEKAYNKGEIKRTDVIKLGNTQTTYGRVQINNLLPTQLQNGPILKDLSYRFTKSEQGKLSNRLAKLDKKNYPAIANSLKNLGNDVSTADGFSLGLEDFKVHKDIRDPILKAANKKAANLDLTKKDDQQKFADIYEGAMNKMESALQKRIYDPKQRSQLARLEVAAGIKGKGYRQLTAAPVLFVDSKGEVVTSPVEKSYAEGLSTTDYWAATSGGRKGIIQKVQSVAQPGYLTKMMTNSMIDTLVAGRDCKTDRGISLSIDEPDIIGRYTSTDHKLAKGSIPRNTMITPELLTRLRNNKITKVVVRSPMRCNHSKGVCQYCSGTDENGSLPDKGTNVGILASQALGERGTQLAMKSFHSGGVYEGRSAAAKSIAAGGLDRATSLLYLKQKVLGSATLAKEGGKITNISKDPAGGYNVMIGKNRNYIPADRALQPNTKVGATIKKGDPLSKGPINPHEMLPLIGMSKVQGHLAQELHKIYGAQGIRRRNSEVLVRAISNVTKIEDRGDHPDLLPGDFAHTNQIYAWNKDASKSKLRPIKHAPVLRGVKQIPLDVQEDWMARLNHEHLKSTLIEASQQGWRSKLHGYHPIPPLIMGAEFGKGTDKEPWTY